MQPGGDDVEVAAHGLLVAAHLQVPRLDLAQAVGDGDRQTEVGGQRGRRLLGPHERRGGDRPDAQPAERGHEGRGLVAAELAQVGAGDGGVEQVLDVGTGLAVTDEEESHAATIAEPVPDRLRARRPGGPASTR